MMNITRTSLRLGLGLLGITLPLFTAAGEGVKWGYTGDTGPEHWGELSEDFAACRVGKNQSPINIVTDEVVEAELDPLVLEYEGEITEIVNNGHTLQMNVTGGSLLKVEGKVFKLLQFHLHSPSEHQVNGEAFPLEVHFVHQGEDGELAVVGRLYREGEAHAEIFHLERKAPTAGKSVPFEREIKELFPKARYTIPRYYRYSGSLTTPPCSEGLRWYVYPSVGTVSREQIDFYVNLLGEDARGPQPINARLVLEPDD